jgi:hypothetical protein
MDVSEEWYLLLISGLHMHKPTFTMSLRIHSQIQRERERKRDYPGNYIYIIYIYDRIFFILELKTSNNMVKNIISFIRMFFHSLSCKKIVSK